MQLLGGILGGNTALSGLLAAPSNDGGSQHPLLLVHQDNTVLAATIPPQQGGIVPIWQAVSATNPPPNGGIWAGVGHVLAAQPNDHLVLHSVQRTEEDFFAWRQATNWPNLSNDRRQCVVQLAKSSPHAPNAFLCAGAETSVGGTLKLKWLQRNNILTAHWEQSEIAVEGLNCADATTEVHRLAFSGPSLYLALVHVRSDVVHEGTSHALYRCALSGDDLASSSGNCKDLTPIELRPEPNDPSLVGYQVEALLSANAYGLPGVFAVLKHGADEARQLWLLP